MSEEEQAASWVRDLGGSDYTVIGNHEIAVLDQDGRLIRVVYLEAVSEESN